MLEIREALVNLVAADFQRMGTTGVCQYCGSRFSHTGGCVFGEAIKVLEEKKMSRYLYVTAFGKEIELDDWMITEHGLEGIQVVDGKVILVLMMPDGGIIYDYDSDRKPDDIQRAKERYKALAKQHQQTLRDRAKLLLEDSEDDDDEGPVISVPVLDTHPAGYG
jgi:hypothetical protein